MWINLIERNSVRIIVFLFRVNNEENNNSKNDSHLDLACCRVSKNFFD